MIRVQRHRIVVAAGLAVIALFVLGGGILVGASSQFRSLLAPAVPALLTYQGLLSDEGGTLLTGPYTMTFGLYPVSEGGEPLWVETQPVTVTDGLFNAYLGAASTLSQTLFDGQDLYLGVTVGNDDEMRPRTRVGSVPYAFTSGQVLAVSCDLVGLTDCSGQCVNRQTDRDHCGRCDQSCGSGYICQDGVCALSCQPGLSECGGQCVDTQIDPRHCGECGSTCSGGAPICVSGSCAPCP
jgi:hypothetical protein